MYIRSCALDATKIFFAVVKTFVFWTSSKLGGGVVLETVNSPQNKYIVTLLLVFGGQFYHGRHPDDIINDLVRECVRPLSRPPVPRVVQLNPQVRHSEIQG